MSFFFKGINIELTFYRVAILNIHICTFCKSSAKKQKHNSKTEAVGK